MLNANLFIRYIKKYSLTVVLLMYLGGTTVLKAFTQIDITIPCLIKLFTGHSCYGCGLTTAVTHLLKFEIHEAYEANALVFIVLPVLLILIVRHWMVFRHEQENI